MPRVSILHYPGAQAANLVPANSQTRRPSNGLAIDQALGVNSSFDRPLAQPQQSAMRPGPLPAPAPARRPSQSQPVPHSRRADNDQADEPPRRPTFSQPVHATVPQHPPARTNRHAPIPPRNPGHVGATLRRQSGTEQQHVSQTSPSRPSVTSTRTRPTKANALPPRVPSPPPRPVPHTREPPTAAELGLDIEPADFERIVRFIDDRIQSKVG